MRYAAARSEMRVAIYCGVNLMPWGPESLFTGIGGSEEAAILMARELARQGCEVSVYANLTSEGHGVHAGVRWLPWQAFSEQPPGDVFIAWRHPEFAELAGGWRQVHHWLHNRQEYIYPSHVTPRLDRILLLSRDHGRDPGFSDPERAKFHYTSNGLDPQFLRDAGRNEPDRAIYASCPARGLLEVLDMWPRIKRAVPAAKLDVYNGFTRVYEVMTEYYPGLAGMKAAILRKLDQDGVTFHGMVGQDRLAEGFARAGVWLYPTTCRETSPITAMKALAMGCLPVTSGIGVLGETLGGRDLGPVDPDRLITKSRRRLWMFRRRVIQAMKQGASPELMARRMEWSRWARERYSWSAIAREWMELFREIARDKQRDARVA
jgi:glycosyltransferase involved in cell wall biosynthesis